MYGVTNDGKLEGLGKGLVRGQDQSIPGNVDATELLLPILLHILRVINAKYTFIFVYRRSITRLTFIYAAVHSFARINFHFRVMNLIMAQVFV